METDSEKKDRPVIAGDAIGLGTTMAVAMALFGGGGYYLDHRRGDGFVFTLAGILLGLLFCVYEVFVTVRRIQQADKTAESRDGRRGTGGGEDGSNR